MFALSFLYSRPKGRRFDYDYHRKVHIPLGIGLAFQELGIKPEMIWTERIGEHDQQSTEPWAAISYLLFRTKEERDRLLTLFDRPHAAQRLMKDWPHYTEEPPQVRLSEWTADHDIDSLIETFNRDLRDLHA